MRQNQAADNFATTLSAAISSTTATSMTLADASAAPSVPFIMSLAASGASGPPFSKVELVQVTACNTGTGVCTVARGYGGSTANTWSSGDSAENVPVAADTNDLMQGNWPRDFSKVLIYPLFTAFEGNAKSGSGFASGPGSGGGSCYVGAGGGHRLGRRLRLAGHRPGQWVVDRRCSPARPACPRS